MSTPPRGPMTALIIEALEGDIENVTFHDAVIESAVPPASRMPWGIVHSIAGGGFLGPMSNETSFARQTWQIDACGVTRVQAEWLHDKITGAITDRETNGTYRVDFEAPDDWAIGYRELHDPAGVFDTGQAPAGVIFASPVRVTFWVSPT